MPEKDKPRSNSIEMLLGDDARLAVEMVHRADLARIKAEQVVISAHEALQCASKAVFKDRAVMAALKILVEGRAAGEVK